MVSTSPTLAASTASSSYAIELDPSTEQSTIEEYSRRREGKQESLVAKLFRLVLLLRYLFTDKQHLILSQLSCIFGDRFRIPLLGTSLVVITDPESIQELLGSDESIASAGPGRKRFAPVFPDQCIFYASGERHQKMRQAVSTAFGATVQKFDVRNHVAQMIANAKNVAPDRREEVLQKGLNQIAGKFIFGQTNADLERLAGSALKSFANLHTAAFIFPWLRFIPYFGRGLNDFAQVQNEIMKLAEQAIHTNLEARGFIAQLMNPINHKLTDDEIRDNATFFFLVFVRTLTSLFRNVAHAIAVAEPWQNRLRNANIDAARMHRAAVKETLRLHPFAPVFVRLAKKSICLDGYDIRPNEYVIVTPWLTHRRASSFHNPNQFDPGRFTNSQVHRYSFIPFGGGKNHCIGSGWSINVISQLMQQLVAEFRLVTDDREQADAKRFSFRAVFLIRSKSDFRIEALS